MTTETNTMGKYQVILSNSEVVNVPTTKARTKYEYIRIYGLQAVLERARRSRAFKAALAVDYELRIRAIVCPNGDVVTQF